MEYGILCNADMMSAEELVNYAQAAERAGLTTIWVPELFGRDPFVTCGVILANTTSIRVGTAIANVYARDARATKAAAYSLADSYNNRFELGLGLSNKVGNTPRGHEWLPPLQKMQDFTDRYDESDMMFKQQCEVNRYLAAHGPKLMQFAAERMDGAYSYLQTLAYTEEAKKKLGDKKLHLMQPTVFSDDPVIARDLARKAVAVYLSLENYHRAWRERGFADSDFADGGSDAFIDTLVIWGDDETIKQRYLEQAEQGADQIIIIPVGINLKADVGWSQLSAIVS